MEESLAAKGGETEPKTDGCANSKAHDCLADCAENEATKHTHKFIERIVDSWLARGWPAFQSRVAFLVSATGVALLSACQDCSSDLTSILLRPYRPEPSSSRASAFGPVFHEADRR